MAERVKRCIKPKQFHGDVLSYSISVRRNSVDVESSTNGKRVRKRKHFYDELYHHDSCPTPSPLLPPSYSPSLLHKQRRGSSSSSISDHQRSNDHNSNSSKRKGEDVKANKRHHSHNNNNNSSNSNSSSSSSSPSSSKTKAKSPAAATPGRSDPSEDHHHHHKKPDRPDRTNYLESFQKMQPQKSPVVPDMDPVHFLRCHSDTNRPDDNGNKVWLCRFEPRLKDPARSGRSGQLIATCGGKIICLVDSGSGRVMMRYKDSDKEENFYAMAWTTLEISGERNRAPHLTNILAVAGEGRQIKLLHPSQLVIYANMAGHKKCVTCLLFHPAQSTWLFSGSDDRRIILWDIGVPTFPDYSTKHVQMIVLESPGNVVNLAYSSATGWLLAGTEDGCYGWSFKGATAKLCGKSRKPPARFCLPRLTSSSDECVDGLVLLDDNTVATKCVEEGYIYLWNLPEHTPPVTGTISRASAATSLNSVSKIRRIAVRPFASLKYVVIDEPYIYMSGAKDRLVVGDPHGRIFIYNLTNIRRKSTNNNNNSSDNSSKGENSRSAKNNYLKGGNSIHLPSRVLDWPTVVYDEGGGGSKGDGGEEEEDSEEEEEDRPIINSVVMDDSGEVVAATADCNLVCIWKSRTD